MKKLLLLIMLTTTLVSCRKHDIRVIEVRVPGLKNTACAAIIQEAFMRQPGIRSIEPDFDKRTLTVTYDSMVTALKNIEFTITEVGFDANDELARPEAVAKLPPECREPEPASN